MFVCCCCDDYELGMLVIIVFVDVHHHSIRLCLIIEALEWVEEVSFRGREQN